MNAIDRLARILEALRRCRWDPSGDRTVPTALTARGDSAPPRHRTEQNVYEVVWRYQLLATSPYEAAQDARASMLRTGTDTPEFFVTYRRANGRGPGELVTDKIDLSEPEDATPWWTVISFDDREAGELRLSQVMSGQRRAVITYEAEVPDRYELWVQHVRADSPESAIAATHQPRTGQPDEDHDVVAR